MKSGSHDPKPKLAVWKFSSCDGCQLSILDCEDQLLALADAVQIAYFPEATRAQLPGPYDISLVEGSITTPEDLKRIQHVRKHSKMLVAIGACATSGGIQALRNFSSVKEFAHYVYPHPEYLQTLETSTALSEHVTVDYELRGCPISKSQLLEFIAAVLCGRKPAIATSSVCEECKRRETTCVMVSKGIPCMGPVTQSGCGAICPAFGRGCYGCFGPKEHPNTQAMDSALIRLSLSPADRVRHFQGINANAPEFLKATQEVNR